MVNIHESLDIRILTKKKVSIGLHEEDCWFLYCEIFYKSSHSSQTL